VTDGGRLIVRVTRHALTQARDRLGPVDVTDIVRDVRLAIHQGRTSRERPSFLSPGEDAHGAVFAWNQCRDRCYVVAEDTADSPNRRVLVVTTLTPLPPATAELPRTAIAFAQASRRAEAA
jgi:hypothetical protein